jgi:hypothetical protein
MSQNFHRNLKVNCVGVGVIDCMIDICVCPATIFTLLPDIILVRCEYT